MDIGKLGVWYFFEGLPAPAAAEAAKRIESLGYGALLAAMTSPYVDVRFVSRNATGGSGG